MSLSKTCLTRPNTVTPLLDALIANQCDGRRAFLANTAVFHRKNPNPKPDPKPHLTLNLSILSNSTLAKPNANISRAD